MADFLQWPNEFDDPTPATDLNGGFIAFLEEMCATGATVSAERDWSLFEFCRDERCIHFVRRGRSRRVKGQFRLNCETYWEVILTIKGVPTRLGSLYGIREFACVAVCGLANIRLLSLRWLNGASLADAVSGIILWDRANPSSPLEPIAFRRGINRPSGDRPVD